MFGANYTGGGILNYRSAEEINSAMGRVYGHMSLAVIVSMIVSYFVGSSPELLQFFFTGVTKWIVIFAPLAAMRWLSVEGRWLRLAAEGTARADLSNRIAPHARACVPQATPAHSGSACARTHARPREGKPYCGGWARR